MLVEVIIYEKPQSIGCPRFTYKIRRSDIICNENVDKIVDAWYSLSATINKAAVLKI